MFRAVRSRPAPGSTRKPSATRCRTVTFRKWSACSASRSRRHAVRATRRSVIISDASQRRADPRAVSPGSSSHRLLGDACRPCRPCAASMRRSPARHGSPKRRHTSSCNRYAIAVERALRDFSRPTADRPAPSPAMLRTKERRFHATRFAVPRTADPAVASQVEIGFRGAVIDHRLGATPHRPAASRLLFPNAGVQAGESLHFGCKNRTESALFCPRSSRRCAPDRVPDDRGNRSDGSTGSRERRSRAAGLVPRQEAAA